MSITWKDLESQYQDRLASLYPPEEIKALFLLVLSELAGIKPSQYLLIKNDDAQAYKDQLEDILTALSTGRPIQHVLGMADFYGHKFVVNEHTLIPRPETEELVHLILQDYKQHVAPKIIDIGTGSGCIPITLNKLLADSEVWAVDISAPAIAVAKKNNQQLQTAVNFITADILEWEFLFSKKQNFDVIVSNPPYITQVEMQQMHANVLNHEPHTALFVEDAAPLLFYHYISDFALHHLSQDGTLYFEINQYLGNETADLIRKKGFKTVDILKDINGADRMIRAKRG